MLARYIWLAAAWLIANSSFVNAHGSYSPEQSRAEDWATWHMQEEHHIDAFDAASFFTLHDFDSSGTWTPNEIQRTYGLDDVSNASLSEDQKKQVVQQILMLFDRSRLGFVTREDWVAMFAAGKRLPDFGFGPGHHGDMEYEYEIHHFEKFHGEGAKEEDLTHPEDIEHFRAHDEEEDAAARLEQLEKMQIVEANIPQKFLRYQ